MFCIFEHLKKRLFWGEAVLDRKDLIILRTIPQPPTKRDDYMFMCTRLLF